VSKALLIGPFTGELGHEIYHWSSHMRWFAKTKFAGFDVIACSFVDREFLYRDFATEFWPVPWDKDYCHRYSLNQKPGEEFAAKRAQLVEEFHSRYSNYEQVETIVPVHQVKFRPVDDYSKDVFVQFTILDSVKKEVEKIVRKDTVLLLFRQRGLKRLGISCYPPNRDWPFENWVKLGKLLVQSFHVVIGGGFWTDEELNTVFPRCDTLRDIPSPLDATYWGIRCCGLSIGSPSGINHLQWFAKTPSFVFGQGTNYSGRWRQRKPQITNFWDSPTQMYMIDNWQTNMRPEGVYEAIANCVKKLKQQKLWG